MTMSQPDFEGMYAIEEPLQDGNRLRCFGSGFGLQVARIEAPEGQLVGYGEAPTIEVALADAAENVHTGESYRRQYRDTDSRYPHRIYGNEKPVSPLDAHLHRGGRLLAHWACGKVVAGLYNLREVPTKEFLDSLVLKGKFPTIATEFGRTFAISRVHRGLGIYSLHSDTSGSDFVWVVRNGTGDTLHEAVKAAFEAEQVKSGTDIFH